MLRGMGDFGRSTDDEGEVDTSAAKNTSKNLGGRASVNFADEIKRIPSRKVSDTDTESFTYEHFPVVCPTCRGAGKVHQDDVNELVAFVPVKDERLRPSRIFWKMLIMLIVCACIAGPLAFVLIPRSVQITVSDIKSLKIWIPGNRNATAYILVQTILTVKNENYVTVKISDVDMQASWNKLLLNYGLCSQNISFNVRSRDSLKKSLGIKIYFQGIKAGTAGFQIRDVCGNGWLNHIFVHFATTAKVSYLTQSSQISYDAYPYIQCYNYSGVTDSFWTHKKRKKSLRLSLA